VRIGNCAIALLSVGTVTLSACSYQEIRPTAVEQEQRIAAAIERFGPMRFQQIAPGIWQHTSYIDLPGFGSVPSNGMVVVDGQTSVLIDTAWTVDQTEAILAWAETRLNSPIRAAVLTHAHSDKMGGMDALHSAEVATYAHAMSNQIAPSKDLLPAANSLEFDAGGWVVAGTPAALGPVRVYYPGPGHTSDNITVAIEGTAIAFGGCLIKGSRSKTLGNLMEADLDNYAGSVERFAKAFPQATTIVMSHSQFEDRKAIARTLKLAKDL